MSLVHASEHPPPPIDELPRVCAVVVTHNRKDLLRECLTALLAQSHPLERILVIDNLSSDGTREMMAEEFGSAHVPRVEFVPLNANLGGAGGFHEGVKRAAAAGFDWLWLMDDDTIPRSDALEKLFEARTRFPPERRPDLLASKVLWTDGTLHAMNASWIRRDDPATQLLAAENATVALRAATFVSLLIHRPLVEEHGLPVADYFIWGDDTEYTGRILKKNFGVAVPASVVTHKTKLNHSSSDVSPRFYYHVRNSLWMTFRSRAFAAGDKVTCLSQLLKAIARYVANAPVAQYDVVLKGLWDALARAPSR